MIDGNIVGGLFAGFGALIFINPVPAFTGALTAMLLEGVDAIKINDNVFVPLVAGLVFYLFGFL